MAGLQDRKQKRQEDKIPAKSKTLISKSIRPTSAPTRGRQIEAPVLVTRLRRYFCYVQVKVLKAHVFYWYARSDYVLGNPP